MRWVTAVASTLTSECTAIRCSLQSHRGAGAATNEPLSIRKVESRW
jgi:hypothetical protein